MSHLLWPGYRANVVGDGAEEMGGTECFLLSDLTHSAGSPSLSPALPPDHELLEGFLSCSAPVTTLWPLGYIHCQGLPVSSLAPHQPPAAL